MLKTFLKFSIFLLLSNGLYGDLKDYFKPIQDKTTTHFNQIQHIDFIYLINLDQRPEKFAHCLNELAPYGIQPYRFSAVNGWEISFRDLNKFGVIYEHGMDSSIWGTSFLPNQDPLPLHEIIRTEGQSYFYHGMTPGAIGIILSHLSILQDAYDSNYETIWVMEDDIKIIQNPHLLSNMIAKLDDLVGNTGWDILFTDQNTKDRKGNYIICTSYAKRPNYIPSNVTKFASRITISSEFIKIGARYGAYSMILRRSGIEKILNFYKKYHLFSPYDMDYFLPETINIYTLANDIVSVYLNSATDNAAPNYKKSHL